MSEYSERDVFIIYGRNHQIRDSMFEYLRSLDLNPISFEEAKRKTKKGSPYILEILEKAINNNITIIVLFTPDDIAYLNPFFHKEYDSEKDKNPMGQVRQNVIFETGMAFATNPDRTIMIFFGSVREFSDISGCHYFIFDETGEKRTEFKNLLKSIGCPIKETSDYLSAGDFTLNPKIFQNTPRTAKYSSTKSEIINSVKNLRALSIKIVRNNYDDDDKNKFLSNLKFITQFPEVGAILPSCISQETTPFGLHKYFKEIGGYSVRVQKIGSDFDESLLQIKELNI